MLPGDEPAPITWLPEDEADWVPPEDELEEGGILVEAGPLSRVQLTLFELPGGDIWVPVNPTVSIKGLPLVLESPA